VTNEDIALAKGGVDMDGAERGEVSGQNCVGELGKTIVLEKQEGIVSIEEKNAL
jgi:hypothetical protein